MTIKDPENKNIILDILVHDANDEDNVNDDQILSIQKPYPRHQALTQ